MVTYYVDVSWSHRILKSLFIYTLQNNYKGLFDLKSSEVCPLDSLNAEPLSLGIPTSIQGSNSCLWIFLLEPLSKLNSRIVLGQPPSRVFFSTTNDKQFSLGWLVNTMKLFSTFCFGNFLRKEFPDRCTRILWKFLR